MLIVRIKNYKDNTCSAKEFGIIFSSCGQCDQEGTVPMSFKLLFFNCPRKPLSRRDLLPQHCLRWEFGAQVEFILSVAGPGLERSIGVRQQIESGKACHPSPNLTCPIWIKLSSLLGIEAQTQCSPCNAESWNSLTMLTKVLRFLQKVHF